MKRAWLTTAAYASVALGWAVASFHPLVARPGSTLPDDGDALQGVSVLAWVAHQIVRAPLDLFDMYLYYPHPSGLVYSEHLIPHGVVTAGLQALGVNVVAASNLLVVLAVVALALAVFLWARELGMRPAGAAVAGLVAAFGTSTLEEAPRLQSIWMHWMPLGLYFLHRFFATGSKRAAWGFAACFVMQALTGQYFLVSFPIYLVPVAAGYLYAFPERRTLKDAARLALPLVVLSAILVPVELPYLRVFSHYHFTRPLADGTDLLRYLVPPANNLLYGELFSWVPPTLGQKNHFIGFLTLALAFTGAASLRRRRGLVAGYGLVGLAFLVLTAGPTVRFAGATLGPGPFRFIYDYVPFFDYTRVPERLNVYWVFGLALLAGAGASALLDRFAERRWAGAVLAGGLLLAVPLEHFRPPRHTPIPPEGDFPEVYRHLAETPGGGPLVELPVYPRRFLRFFGYETYFGTASFDPRVFGKASFTPPALELALWTLKDFPSRESTRLLQAMGIERVVYHPHRDEGAARVARRLRRDPNYRFVRGFPEAGPVAARLDYGGELLFDVLPAAMPPPSPRPDERPLPREGWTLRSSSDADPRLAIDGRSETSWSTEDRQRKGQFFDVTFGGERRVSRISLGFVSPYNEFPRALEVNGYHRAHRWRRLDFEDDPWRLARLARQLVEDPASATMDLVLEEPMLLERVRLFIRETDLTDDLPEWRIPEIRIYEAPP